MPKRSKAWEVFRAWKARYAKEIVRENFSPFYWISMDPDLSPRDKKESRESGLESLDNQIEFMRRRVRFMLLDNCSGAGIRRMRRFLSYQLPSTKEPAYELVFWGGCPSSGPVVRVNSLDEFDFADAWSDVEFQTISVSCCLFRTWTKKRLDKIRKHIVHDFACDGYQAWLKLISGRAGISTSYQISFACKVT